jgi:glutamate synthase domain-containing protein 2
MRGIPVGVDCRSPAAHSAFSDVDSMLEFVETVADATGLPVGIKSAVGEDRFWTDLAERMDRTGRGVDFVTVDGGEGGTGAAPLVFADHVALPFRWAFTHVYRAFAERGLHHDVLFIGSAKLGLPETSVLAMALGCDMVNVAREAMFAVGCIQAQRCHTGTCPTGVATQSAWLQRGVDLPTKSDRVANYLASLRMELRRLSHACGLEHPALIGPDRVDILTDSFAAVSVRDLFGYQAGWGLPSTDDQEAIRTLMEAERA